VALIVGLSIGVGIAGCETVDETLDKQEQAANATVLKRAQFETACPSATASTLSRNLVKAPQETGPGASYAPNILQYTVGVAGCGSRAVYTVLCQSGSTSCTVVESQRSAETPPSPPGGQSSGQMTMPPAPPGMPFPPR
jgi:hypothetical protein